jgi:hypothetical protein
MADSILTRTVLAALLSACLAACGGSEDQPTESSRAQAVVNAPAITYDVATAGITDPLAPVTVTLDGSEASVVVTCDLIYSVTPSPIGLKTIDSRIAVARNGSDFSAQRVQLDIEPQQSNAELRMRKTVSFTFTGLAAGNHNFGLNFDVLNQAGWGHAGAIQETKTSVQVNR